MDHSDLFVNFRVITSNLFFFGICLPPQLHHQRGNSSKLDATWELVQSNKIFGRRSSSPEWKFQLQMIQWGFPKIW